MGSKDTRPPRSGPAGPVAFLVSGIGGLSATFALVLVASRADGADPKEG